MSNFGRQNPQPKKEVGDAVKDKRASVHDAWDSGEHKNATWVPENECVPVCGRVLSQRRPCLPIAIAVRERCGRIALGALLWLGALASDSGGHARLLLC